MEDDKLLKLIQSTYSVDDLLDHNLVQNLNALENLYLRGEKGAFIEELCYKLLTTGKLNHLGKKLVGNTVLPKIMNSYANKGKIDEAVKMGLAIIAVNHESAKAWNAVGYVFTLGKSFEKALNAYNQALKYTSHFLMSALIWYNIGWMRNNMGEFQEAITACEKSLSFIPNDPNVFIIYPELARAYFQIGYAYCRKGRVLGERDKGVKFIKKALDLDPKYFEGWYYLAVLYQTLGKDHKAYKACEKCLSVNKDYSKAQLLLKQLERHKKKPDGSLKDFMRSLGIDPSVYTEKKVTKPKETYFTTTSEEFDRILSDNGGIKSGGILIFRGDYPSLNTFILHQLSVNAQMAIEQYGLERNVLYIDSKSGFDSKKIELISKDLGLNYLEVMEKITVKHVESSNKQIKLIQKAPILIDDKDIGIIIIDSISQRFLDNGFRMDSTLIQNEIKREQEELSKLSKDDQKVFEPYRETMQHAQVIGLINRERKSKFEAHLLDLKHLCEKYPDLVVVATHQEPVARMNWGAPTNVPVIPQFNQIIEKNVDVIVDLEENLDNTITAKSSVSFGEANFKISAGGIKDIYKREEIEPEKQKKIEDLQLEVEKINKMIDSLGELCDTLPKCSNEDSCETCETYTSISTYEKRIEEIEEEIQNLEGEIPSWELVEIPEENIENKLMEKDFRYLFENKLMKDIAKEDLKPHFNEFLGYLEEREGNRNVHQDMKDIAEVPSFNFLNDQGEMMDMEEALYFQRINRIISKIRKYFGEEELTLFLEREKSTWNGKYYLKKDLRYYLKKL